MACNSCSPNDKNFNKVSPKSCSENASDIMYTGPNLSCIQVDTNTSLDDVFQKINDTVCSEIIIDWSSFNYSCLTGGSTAKDFVEEISSEFCTLESLTDAFINTTFPAYQATVNNRFIALELPEITSLCTINGISISNTDSVQTTIQKLSDISCYLNTQLNPSSANWNTCYTVSPTPTTIVDGFNTLISQICSLKSTVDGWTGLLPTFNNIGTCLPTPSASESLYDTVVKIRDKACASISYDVDSVAWQTCINNPTSSLGTTLEDTISHLAYYAEQALLGRLTSVSSDFTLSQTTPGNPCSGLKLEFNPGGTFANNKVSLNSGDTADYLLNKLTPGTNISFDTVTNVGEIIINGSVGTDQNVRITNNDTTPNNLNSKIVGSSGEITINTTVIGTGNEQLQLSATLDADQAADSVLDAVLNDSALQAKFCTASALCNSTSTSSPTFYVSDRQSGTGNGSPENPYKTIDEAYAAVVGNGTASTPQYPNSTIYIYKGTYSTNINGYTKGITYHFESGTVLNYTGTDYFIDYVEGVNYNGFSSPVFITGGLIFRSFTGGLVRLVANPLSVEGSNIVNIEMDSAEYYLGAMANPVERPMFHIEVTNPANGFARPILRLRFLSTLDSNGQTLIYAVNGPRLYIDGSANAHLRMNSSTPSAYIINWTYPRTVNNTWSHNSVFDLRNAAMSSGATSLMIHVQGMTGQANISNITFYNISTGGSTNRFLYLDNHEGVGTDGSAVSLNPFIIRNISISKDINFSQVSTIISGIRSNSNYNNISLINCNLDKYDVDYSNLNVNTVNSSVNTLGNNVHLGTGANSTAVVDNDLIIAGASPVSGKQLLMLDLTNKVTLGPLTGTYTGSGGVGVGSFTVTHNMGTTPSQIFLTPASAEAVYNSGVGADIAYYIDNITSTTFDIVYSNTPPQAGVSNLVYFWMAIP